MICIFCFVLDCSHEIRVELEELWLENKKTLRSTSKMYKIDLQCNNLILVKLFRVGNLGKEFLLWLGKISRRGGFGQICRRGSKFASPQGFECTSHFRRLSNELEVYSEFSASFVASETSLSHSVHCLTSDRKHDGKIRKGGTSAGSFCLSELGSARKVNKLPHILVPVQTMISQRSYKKGFAQIVD